MRNIFAILAIAITYHVTIQSILQVRGNKVFEKFANASVFSRCRVRRTL